MGIPSYFHKHSLSIALLCVSYALLPVSAYPKNKTAQTHQTREVVQACVPIKYEQLELIKKLRWQQSDTALCGGVYKKTAISYVNGFQLTADDLSLSLSGRSTVKGNILVKHEDKMLSADLAHIYRYGEKVKKIELINNVVFVEPQRRLIAKKADFEVEHYAGTLEEVLYRIFLIHDPSSKQSAELTAWGQSCSVERDNKGNLMLHQVTYSTCPLGSTLWYLKAREISLLEQESKGVARDTKLYFKNIPILYWPYLSFPLDSKRKSGFLGSQLAINSQNGLDYLLPYYLNLAPNMDATIFTNFLTQRGLLMGGEFRYLFKKSFGSAEIHVIPSDRDFKNFKQSNLYLAPELANLSDFRYSIKWLHNSELADGLNLHVNLEAVSDDYYLQDFNHNLSMANFNQLLRQATLSYHTTHWQYHLLVQDYQTLHPFNQSVVQGVYALVPSFKAVGNYDFLPLGLTLQLQSQLDHYIWNGDNVSNKPEGTRYFAAPTLSWYKAFRGGYINPKVTINGRYYDLSQYNGAHKIFSQVLPISSFDVGAWFDKSLENGWQQTLEPRLFYLYVPYSSQYQIPIFDSGNMFPSYEQLFRTNRFAGFDRVGDANHLSFGVKSRFLDGAGIEQLTLSAGSLYKFQQEKVFACQNVQDVSCTDPVDRVGYASPNKGWGPVQFQLEANISDSLSVFGNAAIDARAKKMNNAMVNFHYEPKSNHIINAGYGFVLNGDPTRLANVSDPDINLHQIRLSYAWPFNAHWRSVGAWSYNLSHAFSAAYFAGLQYDNCCMAVRFLAGRTYRFLDGNGNPVFGNNVYLQLLLKGLGSAANSDPSGLIQTFLPTFRDQF